MGLKCKNWMQTNVANHSTNAAYYSAAYANGTNNFIYQQAIHPLLEILYTQKHLVPPWCVKTSVVAINGYNFINIEMTQMVTFSNICPEWYTLYVFKQNFEIFIGKLSIKRFKLTSSISRCKLRWQLTAGGPLI